MHLFVIKTDLLGTVIGVAILIIGLIVLVDTFKRIITLSRIRERRTAEILSRSDSLLNRFGRGGR